VLLISIAEHGLTPNAQAARMTYAASPESLQSALAAGILGCGSVILGAAEAAGGLLVRAQERVAAGATAEEAADAIATEARGAGTRLAGFGHPLHKPTDPRCDGSWNWRARRGWRGRIAPWPWRWTRPSNAPGASRSR
jgi:citrate synthase